MLRFIAQTKKHRMETNQTCMNIFPFLSISRSCEDVIPWVKVRLTQAGLHPVQTFDLHTARIGLREFPCPNHGIDECDCQMVIILVYDDSDAPETLILHGNGQMTWLSVADAATSNVTDSLVDVIKDILTGNSR